jgi:glycosyltransferase involved in cell wall biosynthesis
VKIFYVYYHSYQDMPIHVSDVVEEFLNQGDEISLFTSINPAFLNEHCPWRDAAEIINLPTIPFRFLSRIGYSILLLLLLPVFCLLKKPSFIYERASLSTLVTVFIARLLHIPLVVEVNGIVVEELRFGNQPAWRIAATRLWESIVYLNATLIVSVTEKTKESLIAHYRLPPHVIAVVTNGTNTRRFCPMDTTAARKHFGLADEGALYVGFLGTLTPWSGADLIPECAPFVLKEYPNAQFLIGGGQEPSLSSLKRKVRTMGLEDHFRFFGQVPWGDAATFINTLNVALAPTLVRPDSGISPLKLFSYLACGKPVVGSDAGEIGEVIREYQLGVTFSPGDVKGLADAIVSLLSDREHRQQISDTAPRVISSHFSWTIKVAQMKQMIKMQLGRKRNR